MPQPLFEAKQHGLFVIGFGIDDAVGIKPRAKKRRGKEIAGPQTPQHRTLKAGDYTGRKEHGGRAMHRTSPAACDLMQRAELKPALRQAGIERCYAKGQDATGRAGAVLEMYDPGTQLVQKKFLPRMQHGFHRALGPFVLIMF